MRNTYYMVGIERSKDPELSLKQRNTSHFVILDDRKHGRSGKFPVFYDIDTGDYLEPPEGFLDSQYETLREWYLAYPDQDPTKSDYKASDTLRDASTPLEPDQSVVMESELTDEDIPAMRPEDEPPVFPEDEEPEPDFNLDQVDAGEGADNSPAKTSETITAEEVQSEIGVQIVEPDASGAAETVASVADGEPPEMPDDLPDLDDDEDDTCPF